MCKAFLGSEKRFQIAVAEYLDMKGVLWMHTPNGGSRNSIEAMGLKRQGVKRGVPDVIILEPRGRYSGLCIELKVKDGKPRREQLLWLKWLNGKGYKAVWTNSLDKVVEIVENYLKIK